MFNKKHLTGIGELNFLGADPISIDDELGGFVLMYSAIHGEDDKKNMLNPKDQAQYELDFNQLFNS